MSLLDMLRTGRQVHKTYRGLNPKREVFDDSFHQTIHDVERQAKIGFYLVRLIIALEVAWLIVISIVGSTSGPGSALMLLGAVLMMTGAAMLANLRSWGANLSLLGPPVAAIGIIATAGWGVSAALILIGGLLPPIIALSMFRDALD